jgi:hypothetical protein
MCCKYQPAQQDNYNEGGNISSPAYAKPGTTLTRVKEWPLAGVAHVETIVGPSELMIKQCLIPLHLQNWLKKDHVTVNSKTVSAG